MHAHNTSIMDTAIAEIKVVASYMCIQNQDE